jgi:uncharacterized protein involved in exopolysaccharide biosynthesis
MKDGWRMNEVVGILWEWKTHVTGTTLGGMIIAALVLLLMPNYYQASTKFYPVAHTLLRPIVDGSDRNLFFFGDDYDIDRLLSIAKSDRTAKAIISQNGLYGYYELDSLVKADRVSALKRFKKHYQATKTQYAALEISFEDKDPTKASVIANAIRKEIDKQALELISGSLREIVTTTSESLEEKEKRLDQITEELKSLRQKYRIYDTDSQAEALAQIEAENRNGRRVDQMISDYTEGVSLVKKLETDQEELGKIVIAERNNLDKIKASLKRDRSAIHVVDQAEIPEKKSRPRRTLLVLAIGLILAFFSSLTALMIEKGRPGLK